ncbi:MAG: thiamine phosphate synthase [Gammaproteobacteria bacterium]|nr:thiamine phosphate synthase [Gammaproteobacteria bacterium]HAN80752.1 thiamine phosphate synthase [Gammaproteobacteria bacterium]|tara:strand:+ start:123 stop:731 length:609 start_codon:yes stop_codon:yes gene_type:complete
MQGLYVITDASVTQPEQLYRQIQETIEGGAAYIQMRHKGNDLGLLEALADAAIDICRTKGKPCIINDHVLIARSLGAEGVHLGQNDESLINARKALGPSAIIGGTCHDSTQLMERAVREGATYCAFGRLFRSETKPTANGLSLSKLSELVEACPIPVVAIGGINADNANQVLDTGVSMLAVSGAVFKSKDIGEAARRLSELL